MKLRTLCIVALVALIRPSISNAWIDCGHKVVGLIAWEDLTPKTKAAVSAILKEHPQYQKYLQADLPADADDATKDRTAFATAATWPDLVRAQENPMHTLYNHPSWHYIDIPVFEGYGDPATQPTPKDEKSADGMPANAVEAMQWAEKELRDDQTKPLDKAVALCWMEHIVGDIHQPLHAASEYTPRFPEGDQGGNSQIILSEPPYPNSRENLHLYWDKLPGDFRSLMMDGFIASGVRADPNLSREKLKSLIDVTDYMAWAKESHDLAEHVVYEDGKLDTLAQKKGARNSSDSPVPGLPLDYIVTAEHLAAHQLALAGYRLADKLNAIFDGPK